jgi:transcriptional regulator with XRE-family HTH domain
MTPMTNRPAAIEGQRLARRLRQQLGEELRVARTSAGLGQRGAAQAAGMSHTQLGRIERGEVDVRLSTLAKIARALRISVRDLLP